MPNEGDIAPTVVAQIAEHSIERMSDGRYSFSLIVQASSAAMGRMFPPRSRASRYRPYGSRRTESHHDGRGEREGGRVESASESG